MEKVLGVTSRKKRRKEQREQKRKRKRSLQTEKQDLPIDKVSQATQLSSPVEDQASSSKKSNGRNTKGRIHGEVEVSNESHSVNLTDYSGLDPELAAALRRDDEEIAELESKLGLSDEKARKRLNSEYAKEEGFGSDFGAFLGDLDSMMQNIKKGASDSYEPILGGANEDQEGFMSYSESEESVAMKAPAGDGLADYMAANDNDSQSSATSDEDSGPINSSIPDHEKSLTYRPDEGEDIYGKKLDATGVGPKTGAYVPPHLRNKVGQKDGVAENDDEQKRTIHRMVNSSLNRLSIDSLISVSQSLAGVYTGHSTTIVNQVISDNLRNACVSRAQLMSGLIPVYVAALVCVHLHKGDVAQLGELLTERYVLDLWESVQKARLDRGNEDIGEDPVSDKEASNIILIVCYLYNFGIVHCSLMYDLIRDMIEKFSELDVELLLILLSHSGRALRTDDPSALKEIVLLVKERYIDAKKITSECSRMEFMVTTLMDLKNNKKRKQDLPLQERTAKIVKVIGKVKSSVSATSKVGDTCLRIRLKDLLNVETKGRWWKVGASWAGNLYGERDSSKTGGKDDMGLGESQSSGNEEKLDVEKQRLLELASKYRMNSDTRRSIFCIIMGSTDCDDCFEKLVRSAMLTSKSERETVRVLMECCGNEKTYNKYYAHLASRICEHRPSSKFTFQLAFFDSFKQFESMSLRKAANLSKFLFNLIVDHNILKLNVLKAIDLSTPDDLSENAMIFTTMLLTSILDHCQDKNEVRQFFSNKITRRKAKISNEIDVDIEEMGKTDEGEALMANLTVFFVQVMKASPKYKNGSKFRAKLKAAIKACDPEDFF